MLYFTTPNSICAYQNGSILRLYTLTAEQQKESSVYGLYAEGDTMYVGTARTPNTVTRNPDDPTEPIFAPAAYSTLDLSELHDTVIEIAGERLGTVFIYKNSEGFDIDDIILCEYGTTVVGLEMLRAVSEETAEESRKINVVKSAINTLSYTEMHAIVPRGASS